MKIKILSLFSLLVPIDALNGLLSSIGIGLPLSASYKGALLLLFTTLTINKYAKIWMGVIFLAVVYVIWHLINLGEHLGSTISMIMRLMLFVGIFLYCKEYFKGRTNSFELLLPIFKSSALIISLVLFAGLLGYGVGSYGGTEEGSIGSKGYFIAGNEVSALLFVVYSTVLFASIDNKKELLIWSGLFLFSGIILSSKMAIFSSIISIIYITFFLKGKHIFFKMICCCLILVVVTQYFIKNLESLGEVNVIERWMYFFDSGGIFRLLLSGREELIITPLDILHQKGWLYILLGWPSVRTVEMDPFDTYLHFGFLGCIIIYSVLFYFIIKLTYLSRFSLVNKFVLFVFTMLFIVSCIAGHILYSGMLIPFVAILLSIVKDKNSKCSI
ncbi:MAG: hypothetical protein IKY67_11255 [Paludibacteraceae bacterium]|nr:hypothetical protein [Paludibacteraceae bacterium]